MAEQEHLDILLGGIDNWNAWRRANPEVVPDLSAADLRKAYLRSGYFSRANLQGTVFRDADLTGARFSTSDLSNARLTDALLQDADLERAIIRDADLSGADLRGATLAHADLSRANLWSADLSEVRASAVDLKDANLRNVVACDADFSGAYLRSSDLRDGDFRRSSFESADMAEAKMGKADFREADLGRAKLFSSLLKETKLDGANLNRAYLAETVLANLDLSRVRNIDSCKHLGPSSLDLRTLQSSKQLPTEFLRGCGLSDEAIAAIPSLVASVGDYYSCFISYSSRDKLFSERLHKGLQDNGVRTWFAPHDMKIGDKILDSIDRAIEGRDKLVIVLSATSITSDWVEDEINKAFAEERDRQHPVLFPIRIDNEVFESSASWAKKIKDSRNIGDFREWQDSEGYQQAFLRLLRDLKRPA